MQALQPEDAVVSTYREHGHALARGLPMGPLMAEMYGRTNGCSRGRGGSMHLFDASRRFYGGYAIVGGGIPIAVGLALADRLRGLNRVTACFFGDGAVAEGEFHEALNLAALWRLPVLFLCENNRYAMGTALERHQAQTDLRLKAAGYGVDAATVDGMEVRAVARATAAEAEGIRREGRPFLLEARTYRFRAHSMADPDLYRTKAEIASWKARDPLITFADALRREGALDEAALQALEREVGEEVARAVAFAEAGEWESAADLGRDLVALGPG